MIPEDRVDASDASHETSRLIPTDIQKEIQDKKIRTANEAIVILVFVVLFNALGQELLESPMTRITEAVICYRYYEEEDPSKLLVGRDGIGPGAIGGVDEPYCKVDAVQGELALLRGWQYLFDSIPGLLLAVPVGWAADRYGRKPFALVAGVGFVLQGAWPQFVTWFWQAFDIRAVWLSTLGNFMAGGIVLGDTLFYVIISDVASEARRAEIFFQLGAVGLGAMLTMPPLSAWLMEISSPWIPALIGTLLKAIAVLFFYFCPETLHLRNDKPDGSSAEDLRPSQENEEGDRVRAAEDNDDDNDIDDNIRELASRKGSPKSSLLRRLRERTSFLHNDWRVAALIITFFGHALVSKAGSLALQYLSKRFELSISEATLVNTTRTVVMFFLYLVIFPSVSKLMTRRFSAQKKDLYLARASHVLWSVGWILMGAATSIPLAALSLAIAALGQGLNLLTRSFLASLLPPHQVARAYSFITVVEMIGHMLGSPSLARIFTLGLSLGGRWIGLPFFVSGLVSAAFTVVMFAVGLR